MFRLLDLWRGLLNRLGLRAQAVVLVQDGGFEANWGTQESHRCHVFPKDGEPFFKDVPNIFVPPHWIFWFRHDPGTWDQPEGRDAHKVHDEHRVHSGNKAYMYFTFYRCHDAGLYQQIQVEPGQRLRLTAFCHAWSNTNIEGHEDCFERGRCSCGFPSGEAAFILEGDAPPLCGDPWSDAQQNFTFYVGIDPTGGTDPRADTVVWGPGAHIYNVHAQVPAVEAVAQGSTVTVFLRSKVMYAFKHCDSYVDDVTLEVIGEPEPPPPPPPPPDDGYGMRYWPETPVLGQRIEIEVLSRKPFAQRPIVELALDCDYAGEYFSDGWHVARFRTSPAIYSGHYDVLVDGELLGGFYVPGDAPPPPPVIPPPPPPPPLPDGLPRIDYKRTYILLPQSYGPEWAEAALRGSHPKRFSIGFSADDAGIGRLSDKTVIVVNSQEWE